MKTAEQRIRAAIGEAKVAQDKSQLALKAIAEKHGIQGLLLTNGVEGYFTGWTARIRITL